MRLTIAPLELGCFALNLGDRTVATVTPQGMIDWLLISPEESGPLITCIQRETHLAHVRGLKMNLHLPYLCEEMVTITPSLSDNGSGLRLAARSRSEDGAWEGCHEADLTVNPDTGRFEWAFDTTLTCRSATPVARDWIEYNNILPGKTGRGMLFGVQKEFDCILMTDRDGVIWKFPHQRALHYTQKIRQLHFAQGALAGFFGEALNPVVELKSSTLEPDWAICDMFFDLHCGSRISAPIQPGEMHHWAYSVRYLDSGQSAALLAQARPVPITAEDSRKHEFPRLSLDRNAFEKAVSIDRLEDADYFRIAPPIKVWDRHAGPSRRGALRLTNTARQETVWSAEPPNQIPASAILQLRGRVKTAGVVGKGLFLRLRGQAFEWRPKPHLQWLTAVESGPVTGTTDWVEVATPAFSIPAEHPDRFIWIDVVLDGQGVGWLADMEVDLGLHQRPA